jgi:hypothetical protein
VGSRPLRSPRFVVCRRPRVGTALPEVNSFLRFRQPFWDIAWNQISGNADAVTAVTDETGSAAPDVGLTFGNLVSTLEQSPVRGGTAAILEYDLESAPVSEQDEELTNGNRVVACAPNASARCNKE